MFAWLKIVSNNHVYAIPKGGDKKEIRLNSLLDNYLGGPGVSCCCAHGQCYNGILDKSVS